MSTVLDAPEALSTYMLNGWVLTNRPCPNKGCRMPLMRSPSGQTPEVHFCITCEPNGPHPESHTDATSASSLSQTTRASTPATEVSEAVIDDDDDGFIQFVETEATIRRREQMDLASAELGRYLLQGWTMLGDECPNESCYNVPLVRPPKTGGGQNSRKECVLCHRTYITERDWAGRERLIPIKPPSPAPINEPTISVISPAKDISSQQASEVILAAEKLLPSASYKLDKSNLAAITPTMVGTLQSSAEALELSLRSLTSRLTSLVSGPTEADPTSISMTAEAISKVTHALSQVKQLQWSEAQAHTL